MNEPADLLPIDRQAHELLASICDILEAEWANAMATPWRWAAEFAYEDVYPLRDAAA